MNDNTNTDSNLISKGTVEELSSDMSRINYRILCNLGDMATIELFQIFVNLNLNLKSLQNLISKLSEDGEHIAGLIKKVLNKDLINEMIFSFEGNDRENRGLFFDSLRNDVHKLLLCITGYITEISYIYEISGEILYKEEVRKKYSNEIDKVILDKLYENVYTFLTEDMNTLPNKILDLISVIPLKVSRMKYYDIIKEAFLRELSSLEEEWISSYLERRKVLFNGAMAPGYGQRLDKYFYKAHMLKQLNMEDLASEDLKKVHSDANKYITKLNSIAEVIRQVGYIANRFFVLSILYERNYKFDRNKYEKITNLWDNYNPKDNRDINDKIIDKCGSELESLGIDIQEDDKELRELLNSFSGQYDSIDERLESDLTSMKKVLAYINDTSFENSNFTFLEAKRVASKNYVEEAVENFIEFVDRNIKNMSNKQRKVRMRRLLCLTRLPFKKPEDFFNYFQSSIETNATKEDLIANINLVSEVMSKYTI